MEVKIFTDEGDAPKLEKKINEWLSENKHVDIKHITQGNAADEEVLYTSISIWYEN